MSTAALTDENAPRPIVPDAVSAAPMPAISRSDAALLLSRIAFGLLADLRDLDFEGRIDRYAEIIRDALGNPCWVGENVLMPHAERRYPKIAEHPAPDVLDDHYAALGSFNGFLRIFRSWRCLAFLFSPPHTGTVCSRVGYGVGHSVPAPQVYDASRAVAGQDGRQDLAEQGRILALKLIELLRERLQPENAVRRAAAVQHGLPYLVLERRRVGRGSIWAERQEVQIFQRRAETASLP